MSQWYYSNIVVPGAHVFVYGNMLVNVINLCHVTIYRCCTYTSGMLYTLVSVSLVSSLVSVA
jgi:hypothetical protein